MIADECVQKQETPSGLSSDALQIPLRPYHARLSVTSLLTLFPVTDIFPFPFLLLLLRITSYTDQWSASTKSHAKTLLTTSGFLSLELVSEVPE